MNNKNLKKLIQHLYRIIYEKVKPLTSVHIENTFPYPFHLPEFDAYVCFEKAISDLSTGVILVKGYYQVSSSGNLCPLQLHVHKGSTEMCEVYNGIPILKVPDGYEFTIGSKKEVLPDLEFARAYINQYQHKEKVKHRLVLKGLEYLISNKSNVSLRAGQKEFELERICEQTPTLVGNLTVIDARYNSQDNTWSVTLCHKNNNEKITATLKEENIHSHVHSEILIPELKEERELENYIRSFIKNHSMESLRSASPRYERNTIITFVEATPYIVRFKRSGISGTTTILKPEYCPSSFKESVVRMIEEEINKFNFNTPRDIVDRFSKLYKIAGTTYSFYVDSAEFVDRHIKVRGLCRLTTDGIGYHFQVTVVPKFRINKDETNMSESSKAVRSSDADGCAFHLISPIALLRLAHTYREGSMKYGDYNWTKGFPPGECLNHAIRHIFYYLAGDRSEDHLAHAVWNLFTVMHFEHTNPELKLHQYGTSEQIKAIMDSIKLPEVTKHDTTK